MRAALILTCAWLCAACTATPMRSDVAIFHQLRTELTGKTFALITLEAQDDSAEYETYREIVKEHLLAAGMRLAQRPVDSDYLVAFDYFAGSPLEPTLHVPALGQTGVSGSLKPGVLQPYGATSSVQPVPASNSPSEQGFTMLMYETKIAVRGGDSKPVYEGRVSSRGNPGSLSGTLPLMIGALFEEYPGHSGDMRAALMNCEACGR
ncbi:MAG TPA: DUF4136 domain-containing protein [Steroidobacteraceae bacterium]